MICAGIEGPWVRPSLIAYKTIISEHARDRSNERMRRSWIGSILRFWGIVSRLYLRVAIISLVLALTSIGIYYVVPPEVRTSISSLPFYGVLPIFLLVPVTFLMILMVFLIIIISLIAQKKIIVAVKRRGRISLEDLTMETGIYRQDLLPILKDLAKKKKIVFVTANDISCESVHSET